MQELMAQQGLGNQQSSEQQKGQEEAKREADERRQMMLSQILSSEARERLNKCFDCRLIYSVARIALVKPEKARGVEDVILRAAQMGQVVEKIHRRRSVLEDDD
ncbi:double-stranded DNA-binding family protein [Actinidia rufa]|uniref:Double-stranded DNA-binding family protein n=1 Tax=Actinidia rufa TaxID=165716 RepID=A0A7J0DU87_9ERIC|nr:double-stranded DNA-binding family protein [Actinidia rufa]GFS43178.1 double-stranded DNA-binding family protein [Actinidia rufa]